MGSYTTDNSHKKKKKKKKLKEKIIDIYSKGLKQPIFPIYIVLANALGHRIAIEYTLKKKKYITNLEKSRTPNKIKALKVLEVWAS